MYSITELLVGIASGLLATTYGHGEMMCGPIGKPQACAEGAFTSSGEPFVPSRPTVAVAAPRGTYVRAQSIRLKLAGPFPCRRLVLNDKMNPRWIGRRGFDLSPGAVRLLTSRRATPHFAHPVEVCR